MKEEVVSERLLKIQDLLFGFTQINRLIYFPDKDTIDRLENNAEHSFSLAMAAWFLAGHYPHLNKDLIIKYALVHDLVEVYAGDEQAIGRTKDQEKQKHLREKKALARLKKEWPDFKEMTNLIAQYEKRADEESRFVYALDKVMPVLLNFLSEGKTWKKYDFHRKEVLDAKDHKIKVSEEINTLWQVYRKNISEFDHYFNEGKT